jgi:hypothetical protein
MTRCLTFQTPERLPRDLWLLPWATTRHPAEVAQLLARFPSDIVRPTDCGYRPSARRQGDPYELGKSTDEWGCVFENIQAGVHGEIREPIIPEITDLSALQPPDEILPDQPQAGREAINRFCAGTEFFVIANACPRPWERYQFLRGSENALADMANPDDPPVQALLRAIQDFYLKEIEFWVSTDVDAIMFMDDWGSQTSLLIPPSTWREVFKPLYRDYCNLARRHGKFVFMHSDGYILDIYQDLAEIGVHAINSQIFCMGLEQVAAAAKGKLTFWGEIDRQHIIPSANPEAGRAAVRQVLQHLGDPRGGIIAQLEFGPGGNPRTVQAICEEWEAASGVTASRVPGF